MTNKPKRKGTDGEREVLSRLRTAGRTVGTMWHRTAAGTPWDIDNGVPFETNWNPGFFLLATRDDRGTWLVTLELEELLELIDYEVVAESPVQVEVKRRKKFALHSLYRQEKGTVDAYNEADPSSA